MSLDFTGFSDDEPVLQKDSTQKISAIDFLDDFSDEFSGQNSKNSIKSNNSIPKQDITAEEKKISTLKSSDSSIDSLDHFPSEISNHSKKSAHSSKIDTPPKSSDPMQSQNQKTPNLSPIPSNTDAHQAPKSSSKSSVKSSAKSSARSSAKSSAHNSQIGSITALDPETLPKQKSEEVQQNVSLLDRQKRKPWYHDEPPKKNQPNPDQAAEIERLQDLVREQRHVIDSQKETIKLLMSEAVSHEEISSLRAALASKSPLLQLVAATPMSENRTTTQLRAENAALRREISEMEVRHLNELKQMRSQFAALSSRPMPTDGCAQCKRRIRELEEQLKKYQKV